MRKPARFLTVLLILFLIASCADAGTTSPSASVSTSNATTESEAPAEEEAEDPDAVRFWFAASENGAQVMQQIVEKYNASQGDFRVRMTLYEDENALYEALQAAVAMNRPPDIAVLGRDRSFSFYQKGQTMDLSALLQGRSGFSAEAFFPVFLEQGTDGEQTVFALPVYGTANVLYYNREAYALVKLKPEDICCWQDVAEAAYTVQRRLVCREGFELPWGYEALLDAALSNGGSIYSEDGRSVTVNTPEWVEVWEQFRVWIHEDRRMRIHSGGLDDEWLEYTKADLLDMTCGGYAGSSADYVDLDPEVAGMLPQPAWDEEKDVSYGTRVSLANIFAYSDAAHRAGAVDFLRYLTGTQAQVKWATGTGFIAANREITKEKAWQEYLRENPDAKILMRQGLQGKPYPPDPTGGEIKDILSRAADRLLIENIPAQRVLDEAQQEAQRALEAVLDPLPEEETEEGAEEAGEASSEETGEETP
ncbi:MAG: extracellular solute-binding protein [Lachnospiraceae bacterium]|nr:extracellular solute-binding protein [Lachnospiraceae bacterium]